MISSTLLSGIGACTLEYLEYIFFGASFLLILHHFVKIPSYIFRKLLHFVAFTSIVEMLLEANFWYEASITALLFAAVVYPILCLFENKPWYDSLFVQKRKGEIKSSLVLLFTMVAMITAYAWGILHQRVLAIVAILMWGGGDGIAAIIGIRYGKHKVHIRFADTNKSYEGTIAMFVLEVLLGMLVFLTASDLTITKSLIMTLPAAFIGAYTELISKKGYDTVTVPCAVLASLTITALFLDLL